MLRALILHAVLSLTALGGLEFARPFQSFMVLPMERPVPVWGTGAAAETVTLSFGGLELPTQVDAGGGWRAELPPMPACGQGRRLKVMSGDVSRHLENVLVGEVWLCSGQSNMDFPLTSAVGGKEEIQSARDFPGIRICNLGGVATANRAFTAAERARLSPGRYFEGAWHQADESCTPSCSAVAWWACKTIHQTKRVPVGLVENAVGGSGVEAWLPREVLAARPEYAGLRDEAWLECENIGSWARGRARLNLGSDVSGNHPYRPGFLFDAGVRWWRDFPFTGVLWYQGETNAEIHDDAWNERLITDLVSGWRKVLGRRGLPFVMVQLPRIGGNDPLRKWWPEFRAVQTRAAAKLPGVKLVITEDLGWDSPDVHPPDKRPVGERVGKVAARMQPGD